MNQNRFINNKTVMVACFIGLAIDAISWKLSISFQINVSSQQSIALLFYFLSSREWTLSLSRIEFFFLQNRIRLFFPLFRLCLFSYRCWWWWWWRFTSDLLGINLPLGAVAALTRFDWTRTPFTNAFERIIKKQQSTQNAVALGFHLTAIVYIYVFFLFFFAATFFPRTCLGWAMKHEPTNETKEKIRDKT